MSMQVLVSPYSGLPVAKLIPNEEIEILDPNMKKKLEERGIVVDKAFRKQYHTDWIVYPKDGKIIFAKAFFEYYFKHGLQQQNYQWKGPEALERLEWAKLTDEELATKVVEVHQKYLHKNKTSPVASEAPDEKKRKTASPDKDKSDNLTASS